MLQSLVKSNEVILPAVCNVLIESNNLWNSTQMKESESERSTDYRRNLLVSLVYNLKKRKHYPCMLTGEVGNGDVVVAAHIAPAKSKLRILAYIGMSKEDVSDPRNFLLLAKNVEIAFDAQQISFVKESPISNDLILKIWDDSVARTPIWELTSFTGRKSHSREIIGNWKGKRLNLGSHAPFKRALSYQAYQAYLRHSYVGHTIPLEYGSDTQTDYFKQRKVLKELKDRVVRDIRDEVDSDND